MTSVTGNGPRVTGHEPRATTYHLRTTNYVVIVLAIAGFASLVRAQLPPPHSIPKPATEAMEPQVATLLDGTWAGLEETLDSASALSDVDRAQRVGEAGEIFHAHGAVEPAIACYRKAAELDSTSARWQYLLGYMLKNQGTTGESLEALQRSEDLEASPLTRFRIAEVLAADGRVDAAREVLEPLADVESLRAAVAAELGKIAVLEGDAQRAVERLTAALDLKPGALSLHFPLAQAYRMAGNAAEAEKHAALAGQAKVWVTDPILQQVGERSVSSETYVSMGAQALQAGQRDTAVAAYTKAVELNPENQRAWMNLGVLAKQAGRIAEAEQALARALELDPEYGFAHFNLAELLAQTGRRDDALPHYRAAVAANPKNVDFGIGLADALMRRKAHQEAAEQYARIAELAPDFARPRYLRALALAALGDLDPAADSATQAWQLDSQDEDIARAFVRLASTAPRADVTHRQDALSVAQELFKSYDSTDEGELLAMALAANGRFEEAAAIQGQVVEALGDASVADAVLAFLQANLEAYRRGERAALPWPDS